MRVLLVIPMIFYCGLLHATEVLPITTALTLAHINIDQNDHTIAVLKDTGKTITGIDLSKLTNMYLAPIALHNALGYEKIKSLVNTSVSNTIVSVEYNQLLSPAGLFSHHIALGLNYREHADEVLSDKKPFLFIKTVKPTRQQAIDYEPTRLLDYEVEICARPLHTITTQTINETTFGYFLCGDFTDRATLLRNIDLNNIRTGKGFHQAKSYQGYFPTGPYIVIPREQEGFLKKVTFALARNQTIVQTESAGSMIWDPRTAIRQLFLLMEGKYPELNINTNWLPAGEFNQNITLLTGTPAGVIMRPPSLTYKIKMAIWYYVGFNFLKSYDSVRTYVIEKYIENLLKNKTYLQSGEELLMQSNVLGNITLKIN